MLNYFRRKSVLKYGMHVNPPPNNFSNYKVLMIENDEYQERVLKGTLKTMGISHVTTVADGMHGLELLADPDCRFDIAICDLEMDGMDGIEFVRYAAKLKVGGFILTSVLDSELLISAEAIICGYGAPLLGTVSKPVDIHKLKCLILNYCNSSVPGLTGESNPPQRQWSKQDILCALERQEFTPYFQPKIDLATNEPTDVEILARWIHPDFGVLPPAQFIALMEGEGLVDRLTDSMFRQSLACARDWAQKGLRIGLALNISPLTLQNTEMPNRMRSIVNEYGISPDQITIEVTETALSQHPKDFLETVTRLRMKGFGISIDDFGIGYSSLQQLSQIPFTELKIDRSFVSGGPITNKSIAILESIMELADKLHLRTVAEGIETASEYRSLKSLGCSLGQGFLLAKPMSSPDFMHWHAANHGPGGRRQCGSAHSRSAVSLGCAAVADKEGGRIDRARRQDGYVAFSEPA